MLSFSAPLRYLREIRHVVVVLAALAATTIVAASWSRRPATTEPPTRAASIEVDGRPERLAIGFGSVWATAPDRSLIIRVDPVTQRVVGKLRTDREPAGLAAGYGSLWVSSGRTGDLTRLDPRTGRVLARLPGQGAGGTVAIGHGAVWAVLDADSRVLSKIDPDTNKVQSTIELSIAADTVTTGFGSVWAAGTRRGLVLRVDSETNRVAVTIDVGAAPSAVTAGGRFVWVGTDTKPTMSLIDPASDETFEIELGGDRQAVRSMPTGDQALASCRGRDVVFARHAHVLSRLDPQTLEVTLNVRLPDRGGQLACGYGAIWISNPSLGTISRLALDPP